MEMGAMSWAAEASCKGMDPELFYPDCRLEQALTRKAKLVCAGCPVNVECLAYSFDQGEFDYGVFGGVTPRQRRLFATATLADAAMQLVRQSRKTARLKRPRLREGRQLLMGGRTTTGSTHGTWHGILTVSSEEPRMTSPPTKRRYTVNLDVIDKIDDPVRRAQKAHEIFHEVEGYRDEVKRRRSEAIRQARSEGYTLGMLAKLFGMTRTGIQHMERYGADR